MFQAHDPGYLQVDWLMKSIGKGSLFVFSSIALIFVVVRLEGGGSGLYWVWAAAALVAPLLVHLSSRRSRDPLPVLQLELLGAAFLHGVVVALLEFRPLPSFASVAPMAVFVLVGGLPLLGLAIVACTSGALIVGGLLGVDVVLQPAAASSIVSAVLLIANQMMLARIALQHEAELLAMGESASVGEDVVAN